jgi:hypothetical protein
MSAIVESVPKNDVTPSGQAGSAATVEVTFGKWLPVAAIAVGALLSVVWTASLLGLSLWALFLLV